MIVILMQATKSKYCNKGVRENNMHKRMNSQILKLTVVLTNLRLSITCSVTADLQLRVVILSSLQLENLKNYPGNMSHI